MSTNLNGHAHAHTNGSNGSTTASPFKADDLSPDAAVSRFQAFLRLRTITYEGNTSGAHHQAVQFVAQWAKQWGLTSTIYEYVQGFPLIVATLTGEEPELPAILLNSHFDVVPIMKEMWHSEAFDAFINDKDEVVARGAQDMKPVCCGYMEAIARLRQAGVKLRRTVHLCFVSDEETGGHHATARFVHGDDFSKYKIGFALDEGLANPEDMFSVFWGERAIWWLHLTARGPTGHGSRLIPNTANEKLLRVLNKIYEFRKTQVELLEQDKPGTHGVSCKHELGDVVTTNLTMLKSGVSVDGGKNWSINVIPMTAEAGVDIRIPPTIPFEEFEERVKEWVSDPEDAISYDFFQKVKVHSKTSIDRIENKYYAVFEDTMTKELGHKITTSIFPAGTDGRYLREVGIPVIGFSPIRLQPILLHDHDERLSKHTYLEGVDIYVKLVTNLANMASVD